MQRPTFSLRPFSASRLSLADLLCAILLLSLLYGQGWLLGDPGVGWHLRAGELMLERGEILRSDPFLASPTERPWVHDQWLSDVLFAECMRIAGVGLVQLVAALLCVGTFALVVSPLVAKRSSSMLTAAAGIYIAALTAGIQWFVRPVVFSFFLFAVVYRLLLTHSIEGKGKSARLWMLPPVFALWANLHPAFVLGLALIALAIVSDLRSARSPLLPVFVASLFSTLLTPWGVSLWRTILELGAEPYFLQLNDEWLSPDLLHPAYLPFVITAALLLYQSGRGGMRAASRFEAVAPAAFLLLALRHQRYLPFFAVCAAVPLAVALSTFGRQKAERGEIPASPLVFSSLALVLLVLTVMNGALPGSPTELPSFPLDWQRAAIEPLRELNGPMLNAPDLGGLIGYVAWPQARAALDDRNQLLSVDDYERFFALVRVNPQWRELLRTGGIETLVLGTDYPLSLVLARDPSYRRVGPEGPIAIYRRVSEESSEPPK